jgi:PAS domain S-box-containing protein
MRELHVHRTLAKYGIVVAATFLAFLARAAIGHATGELPPYIISYPAVMLIAVFVGLGPGLLAVALTAATAIYWIIPPIGHFAFASTADGVGLALFTSMGTFMCLVGEMYRRSRDRAAALEKEQAQRKGEALLQMVCQTTTDAVFVKDRQSRLLLANPATLKVIGKPAAEVIGKDDSQFYDDPETARTILETDRRIMESGVAETVEEIVPTAEGRRTFLSTKIPWRDAADHVIGLVGTARDVTQRKQMEEELREGERRFRTMADSIPQLAWVANADGYIHWYNRRWYEYTGTTPEHMVGWGWQSVHDPAALPQVLERWKQAIASGEPFDMEFPLRGADGQFRQFLTRSFPLKDSEGRVVQWFGTNTDISERKKIEEQLRELSQRLTYHVDNSPLAVIEWDLDMRLSRWSAEAERIFGWKAEEVLGKRMEDFRWIYVEDQPQVKEISADLQTGTAPRRFSANRNYRKDGSIVHCEWYNSSMLDGVGHLRSILSLVLDVTQRKHAEEALKTLNETLEHRVAERTALARQQANDLRKLAAALTQVEQHERRRIAQILHDHLQQLLVGAKFNASILGNQLTDDHQRSSLQQVDDLLDQSLEASRSLTVELCPPVLYSGTMAEALRWLAGWMQDKHGLEVHLHVDDGVNPDLEETRIALFQAIRELLLNITKHAKVKKADVTMTRGPGHLQVIVSDNGTGFDPTATAPPSRSGSGFGLVSIRERLCFLGGKMSIDAAPGRGTRITLQAPLSRTDGEIR